MAKHPLSPTDPREFRSAKANRTAALALIVAIALVVVVLAITT